MASSLVIMAMGEDGASEGVLRGDVDTTFVGQDVVIELPVQEAGPEGSGDVLQGHLQVLEDKGVGLQGVADAFI